MNEPVPGGDGALMMQSVDTLEAISRAEIDVQIATAKRYPRDITSFRKHVLDYVKSSPAVAAGCFYTLKRKEKNGQEKKIQGPSVRLAEICLSAWGNVRAGARPVAVLEDAVVSQAVFYDIQQNVAVTMEVRRSIRGSSGNRYSNDMINVTMQAASAIAFRNVIFKGIPAVFVKEAYDAALNVAAGSIKSITASFQNALADFAKLGVTKELVLARLEVMDEKQVTKDMLLELMGVLTAIDTGDSTVEEEFGGGKKPGRPEVAQPQAMQLVDVVDPVSGEVKVKEIPVDKPAAPVEDGELPVGRGQMTALENTQKRLKLKDSQMEVILGNCGAKSLDQVKRKDFDAVVEAMKKTGFAQG